MKDTVKIKRLTTEQLAMIITSLIEKEEPLNMFREIESVHPGFELDYCLPRFEDELNRTSYNAVPIENSDFKVTGSIGYGCEGIYLDTYLEGDIGMLRETDGRYHLTTIKTLQTRLEDMRAMGELLGTYIYYADFVIQQMFFRLDSEKTIQNFFGYVNDMKNGYHPVTMLVKEDTVLHETGYIIAYVKSDSFDAPAKLKKQLLYKHADVTIVPQDQVDKKIPVIDVFREY